MNCKKCGYPLANGAKYCTNCGQKNNENHISMNDQGNNPLNNMPNYNS